MYSREEGDLTLLNSHLAVLVRTYLNRQNNLGSKKVQITRDLQNK